MSKVGDARIWLQAQGEEVGARGRIRPEFMQRYEDYLREREGEGEITTPKMQLQDPKLASYMAPTGKSRGRTRCGFCADNQHHQCKSFIARGAGGQDWTCVCYEGGHTMPAVRTVTAEDKRNNWLEDDDV